MQNTDRPQISVIICTYNRALFLRDCLQSLIEQDLSETQYELIVSDDGSTDETSEIMKFVQAQTTIPAIHYLQNRHGGVNATRNAGIKQAKGQMILFFDDDQLAPSDFLQKIVDAFKENPEVDGIGGPVRDSGGSNLPTCEFCSLGSASLANPEKHYPAKLLGGNMTLKPELFERVGFFDEEISGRGDETEWFNRATQCRFLYLPDLWAWHRRDNFSLWMLCKLAFRKGTAIPIYKRKAGKVYTPRPFKVFRYFGHALVRWCARGASLAFRELGAIVSYLQLKKNRTS
jgi:glycosyltransferase involved in cell wall biosynthesis